MNKIAKRTPASLRTEDQKLTLDGVRACMPTRFKRTITQDFVDDLNDLVDDPEVRDHFRESLLGYSNVLQDPRYKITDYIHAVRYVSFKLLGYTNQESWIRTFPERYQRLVDQKKSSAHIRATVSNYNRNEIVNKIIEQTLVPTHVLNNDIHQKAINELAMLMMGAKSELARVQAGTALLTHLKQPETTKLKLDVEVTADDTLRQLKEATTALARKQREKIIEGSLTPEEAAESRLIQGKSERVD